MKRKVLLCLAAVLSSVALVSNSLAKLPDSAAYQIGSALTAPKALASFSEFKYAQKLPKLELYTLEGFPVNLSDYKGQVLILNVWASWCAPCIQEIPALIKLQGELKNMPVKVMGVSVDEKPGRIPATLKRMKLQAFQTWADPTQEVAKFLPLSVVPTNYVLDGDGNLVGMITGYVNWDDKEVMPFLKKLADKYANPPKAL